MALFLAGTFFETRGPLTPKSSGFHFFLCFQYSSLFYRYERHDMYDRYNRCDRYDRYDR